MSGDRESIIKAGVCNLREYGYPNVSEENILTDQIYSAFFLSMIEGNLGDPAHDQSVLQGLISEINGESDE